MSEVLILSKTKMFSNYCVGGLDLSTKKPIRLLDDKGNYQPINTPLNIGQIYDITYSPASKITKPHIEDVCIKYIKYRRETKNIHAEIEKCKAPIWKGNPKVLFGGTLSFTSSNKAYIPEKGPFPDQSVGFWIADSNIERITTYEGKIRYIYKFCDEFQCNMPYKGCQESIPIIETGTLIRISLAKLLDKPTTPAGFYLQLSGWY